MISRDFDVVLYGASGFAGALTADYLAQVAPADMRIALAGRNESKLRKLRDSLPENAQNWPIIVADASDDEALLALAESARVVATTVGPYALYGMPLARAAAHAGTNYCDLTGETLFVRQSIDELQEIAHANGARLVHSCGFDCVPSDLIVFNASQQATADGEGTLGVSTTYAKLKGTFSGGTIASVRQQVADAADKAKRKILIDKFSLSPDRSAEPSGEFVDTGRVFFSEEAQSWVGPFLFGPSNARVVRRSNALTGYSYGRSFRYREFMATGQGLKGRAVALAMMGGLAGILKASGSRLLQPLLDKTMPAPGEGPDEASRDAGFFKLTLHTVTTTGAKYRSTMQGKGDPGYSCTSRMLAHAAILLSQPEKLPALPHGAQGGVLTPAVALGKPYVQALSTADMSFKVEKVEDGH